MEPVKAGVIFGNPKQKCNGSGICRVSTGLSSEDVRSNFRSCRRGLGLVRTVAPNQLELKLFKYSLCSRVVRQNFNKKNFWAPEPFSLSIKIAEAEVDVNISIPSGLYPILEEKYTYTLFFTVSDYL